MRTALLIVIFALMISSCNKLDEGVVIEKWYEPTRSYMALIPMVISTGKSTSTILIPYRITDNEDWIVKIKGEYNGEERIETIYLNKSQYECLVIGSHLKITEDCSTTDRNNHRERK